MKSELIDKAIRLEMEFMDPSNEYGDEWQKEVAEVLIDKYGGIWEYWVTEEPVALERLLFKFQAKL